jgi:hypothetical protein
MIYIILLLFIIILLPSNKTIENFTINDVDIDAIKNLSLLADSLMKNNKLIIPGGLELNGPLTIKNGPLTIKNWELNANDDHLRYNYNGNLRYAMHNPTAKEWGLYAEDTIRSNTGNIISSQGSINANSGVISNSLLVNGPIQSYVNGTVVQISLSFLFGGTLNIGDVKIFNTDNINIAKNAKIEVSSTLTNYPASNMVDDNIDTFFHSNDTNPWINFIFNTEQKITQVIVTLRSDCCFLRYRGAVLYITNINNLTVYKSNPATDLYGNTKIELGGGNFGGYRQYVYNIPDPKFIPYNLVL